MSLIAQVFLEILTPRNVVTYVSEKYRFKTCFGSQQKTALLVISDILGLFVNALSADGKYSCYKRENCLQAIQMKLSKKQ